MKLIIVDIFVLFLMISIKMDEIQANPWFIQVNPNTDVQGESHSVDVEISLDMDINVNGDNDDDETEDILTSNLTPKIPAMPPSTITTTTTSINTTTTTTTTTTTIAPTTRTERPCSESDGFFKAPGSDQCYKAFDDQAQMLTWADADGLCKDNGLSLAEPKNPIQLRKFLNEKYDIEHYWMGGVGTGSSIQFQRGGEQFYPGDSLWFPSHPGILTSDNCLGLTGGDNHISLSPTGPYFTRICTVLYNPVCEVVTE